MGSHSLLQGVFPVQGLNPGLLCCRQTLYHLSYREALPASSKEGGNATLNTLRHVLVQQFLCPQQPSQRGAEQMPEDCHVRLKPYAHLFFFLLLFKPPLEPSPLLDAGDRGDPSRDRVTPEP